MFEKENLTLDSDQINQIVDSSKLSITEFRKVHPIAANQLSYSSSSYLTAKFAVSRGEHRLELIVDPPIPLKRAGKCRLKLPLSHTNHIALCINQQKCWLKAEDQLWRRFELTSKSPSSSPLVIGTRRSYNWLNSISLMRWCDLSQHFWTIHD